MEMLTSSRLKGEGRLVKVAAFLWYTQECDMCMKSLRLSAHAQARYTIVCLYVCVSVSVCVDCCSCSRINEVYVRVSIGF